MSEILTECVNQNRKCNRVVNDNEAMSVRFTKTASGVLLFTSAIPKFISAIPKTMNSTVIHINSFALSPTGVLDVHLKGIGNFTISLNVPEN